MKYCQHCGTELYDAAVICKNCGCAVENITIQNTAAQSSNSDTLKTVAKIFMLIGCITSAFYFLFPLCWTIPMTVHYWKSVDSKQPVDTTFKVCSLIFVNLIAGIIMLCDKDD